MEYILYIRTSKKGSQFLGLDAQKNALNTFIDAYGGIEVASYIEQVSGAKDDRPELIKALAHCKKSGATLLVSRLDRLSRKVAFIANLMDRNIRFRVTDLPNADEFQLHIYSAMAQQERKYISQRTKEALAVVKMSGKTLGRAKQNKELALEYDQKILPHIKSGLASGLKQGKIAKQLNDLELVTLRGKPWTQVKVCNFIKKHDLDGTMVSPTKLMPLQY
jgi:DNA invertase Pin-like site-specific DNA recombinase